MKENRINKIPKQNDLARKTPNHNQPEINNN